MKILAKSVKISAKCVKTFSQNHCRCFDFKKVAPKIKVQKFFLFVFFEGHVFISVFSGKLGEIWASFVLEVLLFEKKRPT